MNAQSTYAIEPLGHHDRTAFSCGSPELDEYLLLQASQEAKRKVAAPFVMIDSSGAVIGYYTLSGFAVRLAELPEGIAKKMPRYPVLPATLLGRLAIGKAHQGQKLGQVLLMDALYRSWKNTSEVGSIGVVTEALDETARKFYLHHEFLPFVGHPRKLFIAMKTVAKLFAERRRDFPRDRS